MCSVYYTITNIKENDYECIYCDVSKQEKRTTLDRLSEETNTFVATFLSFNGTFWITNKMYENGYRECLIALNNYDVDCKEAFGTLKPLVF